MKKNTKHDLMKRAFTLVELVVVIAIVAILSAVSVITYLSLTDRAKESNDVALTAQLNTALRNHEVLDGSKNKTAYEAFGDLEEEGFDIEKLTPVSNGWKYLWDSQEDQMLLVDGTTIKVPETYGSIESNSRFFTIVSTDAELYDNIGAKTTGNRTRGRAGSLIEDGEYSVYLSSNYNIAADIEIKTSVGIDVGDNQGLNITINPSVANPSPVLVRVNGGILDIRSSKQVAVEQFGLSDKIIVDATKESSVITNGEVLGSIELASGKVEVASTAKVASVVITADSTSAADVALNISSESTVGTVAAVDESLLNNNSNITIPDTVEKIKIDKGDFDDFAGGVGTEKSPYLISTAQQFKNIGKFSGEMKIKDQGKYFTLISDIDLQETVFDDIAEWSGVTESFQGTLDGNGHSLSSGKNIIWIATNAYYNTTFKNLTVVQGKNDNEKFVCLIGTYNRNLYQDENYHLEFNNVTVESADSSAYIQLGNNDSSFINQLYGSASFVNCTNNANLNMTTYGGIFVGGYIFNDDKIQVKGSQLTFINCLNNGNVTGHSVGFFTGNPSQAKGVMAEKSDFSDVPEQYSNNDDYYAVYIKNCANAGFMKGSLSCSPFATSDNIIDDKRIAHNSLANDFITAEMFSAGNFYNGGISVGLNLTSDKKVQVGEIAEKDIGKVSNVIVSCYSYFFALDSSGTTIFTFTVKASETIGKSELTSKKLDYISAIIGSDEFGLDAYNSIEYEERQEDVYGALYKLQKQNDGAYLMIINKSSLIESLKHSMSSVVGVNTFRTNTTYSVQALDSAGSTIGSNIYLSGQIS